MKISFSLVVIKKIDSKHFITRDDINLNQIITNTT
jgi:hypothetical protein